MICMFKKLPFWFSEAFSSKKLLDPSYGLLEVDRDRDRRDLADRGPFLDLFCDRDQNDHDRVGTAFDRRDYRVFDRVLVSFHRVGYAYFFRRDPNAYRDYRYACVPFHAFFSVPTVAK